MAGNVDEHARPQAWAGIHLVALAALSVRLVVACWSVRITYPDELFPVSYTHLPYFAARLSGPTAGDARAAPVPRR